MKVIPNYEKIIFMGDFNIDIKCKGLDSDNLSEFCYFFISRTWQNPTHASLKPIHHLQI